MRRFLQPEWILILAFLGVIAVVPLVQAMIEMRQGEGVRAFEIVHQAPTAANLRAYERSLESVNWAAQWTRPWIQFALFQWFRDGGEKAVLGRNGWYFFKPGLNYMLARAERANLGTNDPLPAIVDFRDQLAARGIRLLVVPVPNKESIYPDLLTARAETWRSVQAPRTYDLLRRLRAANVEVVDLFSEFRVARQNRGSSREVPLYLAQDTHWSPAGVQLAAQAVARRLKELCWVTAGKMQYRERAVEVRRLGDIVRMLQVPPIERRVSAEAVACVQVVRADNQEVYKDTADAEILVLGDSFMRIYQQDEPGAAGFVAHLAKELNQPLMALVNDGGGSTLVRRELRARPVFLKNKKILIWEFVERDIGVGIEGWKFVPLPSAASPNAPGQICDTPTLGRGEASSNARTAN